MIDAIESVSLSTDSDDMSRDVDRADLKARWVLEIDRYERKAEQFVKRGKKIVDRYTGERKDTEAGTVRYNVLWSNLQTLRPALYGKDPTPEVERRFKDKDPLGRTASDVIERCISYTIGKQWFGDTMRQVVLDRLLPGRGVSWVRYLPHMQKVTNEQDTSEDSQELTDDIDGYEQVTYEEVKFDYVHWQDFGHTVARTWQEVDAVWRIAYLDKAEVRKRFPDMADDIPLDQDPEGVSKEQEGVDALKKAKVYEIWDKRTGRVIWLHKSCSKVLDVKDDPLHLEGFFPCPQPLQATQSTSSFIPTADYTLYADQAAELDRLTQRIASITRAIKVVGVFDASVPALQSILNSGKENNLVPVDTWAAFSEKGGLKGAVELLPVDMIADILLKLYEARDKVKQDLWEISGLNDLLRGASDPETTATAEKIKAGFSSVRLKDMQRGVQIFSRELVRLSGEIICEHFSIDTIKQISGIMLLHDAEKQMIVQQQQMQQQAQQHQQIMQQQAQQHQQASQQAQQQGQPPPMPPQMPPMAPPPPPIDPEKLKLMSEPSWEDVDRLLKDNAARSFRIDIETDSTIAQDEMSERQARLQFADMVTKMLQSAKEMMEATPELAPALSETFMFVLRSYKVGRPTESAFQEAMDKMVEKAEQPQQPQPDSDQVKAQSAQQIAQGNNQSAQQIAQMKISADQQEAQQQAQIQQVIESQRVQSEQQVAKYQAQMDMQVAQFTQQAQQSQFEAQNRIEAMTKQHQAQLESQLEMQRMATDAQNNKMEQSMQILLQHLKSNQAIEVAEIGANSMLQASQITAARSAD